MQRERRGREDAEGDGDKLSLSHGGLRIRECAVLAGRLLPESSGLCKGIVSVSCCFLFCSISPGFRLLIPGSCIHPSMLSAYTSHVFLARVCVH